MIQFILNLIFYYKVADIPKEDLICHFTETNEFIKVGQENGAVLVHWLDITQ